MKALTSYFALAITLACIAAIASLAGVRHPVPLILAAVAIGALTGQFALLTLPSFGPLAVILACVVAIATLAGFGIAVPTVIEGLLVAAVTGHFALTLPNSATTAAAAPPASVKSPSPAPAASSDPNQPTGLSITP